jgi:hypothetical protein
MFSEMVADNEMVEQRIRAIREERKQLARAWRKSNDSLTKILIQNKRKMLSDDIKQRLLNLGRNLN